MSFYFKLNSLFWYHWLVISIFFIIVTLFICLQIYLFFLYYKKNTIAKIINNLEIIKLLPLKQRLYRLSEIAVYHQKYAQVLPYWINLYEENMHKFLSYNKQITSLIDNETEFSLLQICKKIKKFQIRIIHLEKQFRELLNSYESVIKIELIQREQATLYRSIFNKLINDSTKLQIQEQINKEYLNYLINVLQNLLYDFENQLTKGIFLKSYKTLDKIGVGLITFIEILDNLPLLLNVINQVIPKQITQMEKLYDNENIDSFVREQFLDLKTNIIKKVKHTTKLLDSLQYKKSRGFIESILNSLVTFNSEINRQQELKELFIKYFQPTNEFVNSIEESFNNLNKELTQIEIVDIFSTIEKELILKTEINVQNLVKEMKKLINIYENNKNDNQYHILIKMLYQMLGNALNAQISLEQVHKLILQKTKEEKQQKELLSDLSNLLMQLNTKLNKIQYQKTSSYFKEKVSDIFNEFILLKETISLNEDLNEQKKILQQLFSLKDCAYKLYNKIKNFIIIDHLTQKALVYGYKFCHLSDNVNNQIKSAQLIYETANYEDALLLVLQTLEYCYSQKLYKKLKR